MSDKKSPSKGLKGFNQAHEEKKNCVKNIDNKLARIV
jgi:hypothetical protein